MNELESGERYVKTKKILVFIKRNNEGKDPRPSRTNPVKIFSKEKKRTFLNDLKYDESGN